MCTARGYVIREKGRLEKCLDQKSAQTRKVAYVSHFSPAPLAPGPQLWPGLDLRGQKGRHQGVWQSCSQTFAKSCFIISRNKMSIALNTLLNETKFVKQFSLLQTKVCSQKMSYVLKKCIYIFLDFPTLLMTEKEGSGSIRN